MTQHLTQISGTRFHAGFGFQFGDLFKSQPVVEIREASVLRDNRHALERGCLLFPPGDGRAPLSVEGGELLLVIGGVGWIELGQAFTERIGYG